VAHQLLPDRAAQKSTPGTIGLVAYLGGDFSSTGAIRSFGVGKS
jgi:hypothetical protein